MFDEMGNPYRPYVRTIADHFKKNNFTIDIDVLMIL